MPIFLWLVIYSAESKGEEDIVLIPILLAFPSITHARGVDASRLITDCIVSLPE